MHISRYNIVIVIGTYYRFYVKNNFQWLIKGLFFKIVGKRIKVINYNYGNWIGFIPIVM